MATGRVPTTANSPLTAKGDLFGYSTTQARVPVGNDGETIVADSSTSTGLRYQAPVQQNPILNSSFQVWQRGTSISYNNNQAYSADRWLAQLASVGTVSRQVTGDTTNLPNIQYCARLQRNSGQTPTSAHYLYQNFESINSIPFAGKTVTYSFYARKGANYSATSNALVANLFSGTGTDQNVLSTYTGFTTVASTTATLTATWQRFSVTGTVATSATELSLGFSFTPTGTAGADDYFEVTGVQLEVGSVATPFKTYAGTIQGELAACQRYFYRANATSYSNTSFAMGYAYATNGASYLFNLPVTQRSASPTLTISAGGDFQVGGTSGGVGVTSINFGNANTTLVRLDVVPVSSSLTVNQSTELRAVNTNAWIGISAEL
jgi:hypothetical protein